MLRTIDAGRTWMLEKKVASMARDITGVACATTVACEVVGSVRRDAFIVATDDGGATWKLQRLAPRVDLAGVACASAIACEAVGSTFANVPVILGTRNGGRTWETQTLPSGVITPLSGVACASATTCEAVARSYVGGGGDGILGTTNGGRTWETQPAPSGVADFAAVACASTTRCEAIGVRFDQNGDSIGPAILGTTNGGRTWGNQAVPGNVTGISGVSCPSATTCEAVARTLPTSGVVDEYPLGAAILSYR
jgi:photosystem II stability/assembly factor-like uncharacterized protein